MDHSDQTYVVFCRIDGIKQRTAEDVAASVDVLRKAAHKAIRNSKSTVQVESLSSVYGRFLLVPGQIALALELAKTIMTSSAQNGVRLAVGVARGRVDRTVDLLDHNVAGVAVNCAARLAHLPDGQGKIAVEKNAALAAIETRSSYEEALSEEEDDQVKNTTLTYRWLSTEHCELGPLPELRRSISVLTVHVVVYDIVEFSRLDLQGLQLAVEKLRLSVSEALRAVDVIDPQKAKDRFWYAPAGDGGAIVFRVGDAAWTVATKLAEYAFARELPIRLGIATGQVVALDGLPVGKGIFEADALSALPPEWTIAVSNSFWADTLQSRAPLGWDKQPLESDPKVMLLSPMTRSSVGRPSGRMPVAPLEPVTSVLPQERARGDGTQVPSTPPAEEIRDDEATPSRPIDPEWEEYRSHNRSLVEGHLDDLATIQGTAVRMLPRMAMELKINNPPPEGAGLKETIATVLLDGQDHNVIASLIRFRGDLVAEGAMEAADLLKKIVHVTLPFYLSRVDIKEIKLQLRNRDVVLMPELAATEIGAQIRIATLDQQTPSFELDDQGRLRAEHAYAFRMDAIGKPSLESLVLAVLEDLVKSLGLDLLDDAGDSAGLTDDAARTQRYARLINGRLRPYKALHRRSPYCAVRKRRSSAERDSLLRILQGVHELVPDLIFIELDPESPSHERELVLESCLNFMFASKKTSKP